MKKEYPIYVIPIWLLLFSNYLYAEDVFYKMKVFSVDPYVLTPVPKPYQLPGQYGLIRNHPPLYVEAYSVADFFYEQITSVEFKSIDDSINLDEEKRNIATIIDFYQYDEKIKTFIGTLDYIFDENFTSYSKYTEYPVKNRQYLRLIFPHLCERMPFEDNEMKFISIYSVYDRCINNGKE